MAAFIPACGEPLPDEPGAEGESPPEEHAGGIINGLRTGERPEVGALVYPRGSKASGCTGTLIGPEHVLTAAHCIDFHTIHRGGEFTINGNQRFPIRRTFTLGNGKIGISDLALSQLDRSVPASLARPAQIDWRPPQYGTWMTVMGVGPAGGWPFGIKQYQHFKYEKSNRILDSGDSGGPVFVGLLSARGPIALVNSYTVNYVVFSKEVWAEPTLRRFEIEEMMKATTRPGVCYRAHIHDVGWFAPKCDGEELVSPGGRDDFQAIQIWDNRSGVSVCYQALANGRGFLGGCDGAEAGTVGQSRNIQAIRFLPGSQTGGRRMEAKVFAVNRHSRQLEWSPLVDVTAGGELGTPGVGIRGLSLSIR